MSTTEESIDRAVPVRTAYDQWTQFEQIPRFMDGVGAEGAPTGGWRGEVGHENP